MDGVDEDMKDRVFATPLEDVSPFRFDEDVAAVFDDMAERSIPFYREVARMTVRLAADFLHDGATVYDLGCSTGSTSMLIQSFVEQAGLWDVRILAVDSSRAMCDRARSKIDQRFGREHGITVVDAALEDIDFEPCDLVILNYTLQFVPPLRRKTVVDRIFNALTRPGALIVSDKTVQSGTNVSRLFVDEYYRFKRAHGYSELEISQKREALENVLIPYSLEEEVELLEGSGFDTVDPFFAWFNFVSLLAVKG
jgi:tRNA (cmo5U34)-methyltransferase